MSYILEQNTDASRTQLLSQVAGKLTEATGATCQPGAFSYEAGWRCHISDLLAGSETYMLSVDQDGRVNLSNGNVKNSMYDVGVLLEDGELVPKR